MEKWISALVIAAVCAMALPAGAELMQPFNLRCEYRINPLGIDAVQPRLSWNLRSDLRAQHQSAYAILVAGTKAALDQNQGDFWDSGKVESGAAIQIAYNGKPLASHQACHWKVKAWDQDGKESPWSEAASWTMGLLAPADWAGAKWVGLDTDDATEGKGPSLKSGRWIWYPEGTPQSNAPVGEAYFRKVITLSETAVSKATWFIAADNEATLYANGKRVGVWSDFKTAGEFVLTDFLKPGANLLAVEVKNAGDNPNPAGLFSVIQIAFASGDPMTISTDDSWKSAKAKEAGWETAGFNDGAWTAAKDLGGNGMDPWKKISPQDSRVLPARMIRKEFDVDTPVRRATAYLSGLGLSELYINGQRIGNDVLSPGCTEYNKRVFYVTHEVLDKINAGKNALGIWLGNGRYFAPRATEPTATRSFSYPKMLFLLQLELEDGSVRTIVSDESWKVTANGPIRANNEYDGEIYDARMELPGWNTPGFDDAQWQAAKLVQEPGGVLSAQMAEPIRVTKTLLPIGITNPKPGMYIYDMGQNMVGWCTLKVNGPQGAVVRMRFAETLKPDGTLYLDNIRGAKVTDEYVLKGGGEEIYEPRFTYHGFRFMEVIGYPGEPTLKTVEGKVVNDDVENAGNFECSNKLVNQIASNIRWGVEGNYRSMPTDCPQRDERQGWLGDRSEECRGESYLNNIAALYAKWVCDMHDAQREDGSVSDVCPAYWPLYNDNVTWPSSFIIVPGMLYDQYGDMRVMERHYDGMKKWIMYMTKYLDNDIMPKDNYGDWCVPPEEQHMIHSKDPARKTPGDFLGTSYFYFDCKLMARYATLLGKQQDADEFLALAERLKTAFNKKFLDENEGKYANGAETTCVLPLAFGLAPDNVREKVFNRLVDHIVNVGKGHLATGLIGGQWLMRTLTDNGRADVAFTLASQSTYPSWGYMVGKGATTIWELWNGDTADPAMNSGNHVMLVGDLNIWLYQNLGGIRPTAPGFKEISLRPSIVAGLDYAKVSHNSPYGQIFSYWEKSGGKLRWQVTIPANVTARIVLPVADMAAITESGKPIAEAAGLKFVEKEGDLPAYTAGSGLYTFEMPAPK